MDGIERVKRNEQRDAQEVAQRLARIVEKTACLGKRIRRRFLNFAPYMRGENLPPKSTLPKKPRSGMMPDHQQRAG
jgi:hypothetical protein